MSYFSPIAFHPIGEPITVDARIIYNQFERDDLQIYKLRMLRLIVENADQQFEVRSKTHSTESLITGVGINVTYETTSRQLIVNLFRDEIVGGQLRRLHYPTKRSAPVTSIKRLVIEVDNLVTQFYELYLYNIDLVRDGPAFEIGNFNLPGAATGASRSEMLANLPMVHNQNAGSVI